MSLTSSKHSNICQQAHADQGRQEGTQIIAVDPHLHKSSLFSVRSSKLPPTYRTQNIEEGKTVTDLIGIRTLE